jgi:hypothetical protein
MYFEICGEISGVETLAGGKSTRDLLRLREVHGKGRWRKRKGFALVSLPNGIIRTAELHWYEASGVGRNEFKIARFVG